MRYGVIADVHGNLAALEAVLARLEGVDAFVCAGDLVGYGPQPNECIERVAALPGLVCVAGNHDLIALGRLGTDRCIPLARQTLAWTARELFPSSRDFLAALPLEARLEPSILLAHGSPGDPQEYVRTPERAEELIGALDGDVLVLGHTHEPWDFEHGGKRLLNPGSVGQSRSRDPRARALILDLAPLRAEFLTVDYDAEATRRALRERGLPENACHLRPRSWLRRKAGGAARRVLRR
jgi:putative phosphoesterase